MSSFTVGVVGQDCAGDRPSFFIRAISVVLFTPSLTAAPFPPNHAVGTLKRGHDVSTVSVSECPDAAVRRQLIRELSDRRAEFRPGGHDDGALDEVLQLMDISRPRVCVKGI